MREDLFLRIFFERQPDKLCRETMFRELSNEGSDEVFSPTCDEWYLGFANDNRSNRHPANLGSGDGRHAAGAASLRIGRHGTRNHAGFWGRSEIGTGGTILVFGKAREPSGGLPAVFLTTLEKYFTSVGGVADCHWCHLVEMSGSKFGLRQ